MFLGDKGVSIVAVAFKVKFCGVREDKCEIWLLVCWHYQLLLFITDHVIHFWFSVSCLYVHTSSSTWSSKDIWLSIISRSSWLEVIVASYALLVRVDHYRCCMCGSCPICWVLITFIFLVSLGICVAINNLLNPRNLAILLECFEDIAWVGAWNHLRGQLTHACLVDHCW